MLLELEIENLALIRSARLRCEPGLNALTGATGAGKTLVLRALELLRGARAERSEVRSGSTSCGVAARFRVPPELLATLGALAPAAEFEDGECILARTVLPDGRSRCAVNGRMAPLSVVKALAQRLVDALGQGESARLAEPAARAAVLDALGGLYAERGAFDAALAAAKAGAERSERLRGAARDRLRRLDFLRFQKEEFDRIAPRAGELAELEDDVALAQSAETLLALCEEAIAALYESDGAAVDLLGRFRRRIADLGESAARRLEPAAEALDRALRAVEDAITELRGVRDGIDADPGRARGQEERLSQLRRLLDRFGPDEDALLAQREAIEAELEDLEKDESDAARADEDAERALAVLRGAAAALDAARGRASHALQTAVQRELRELGLENARFRVDFRRYAADGDAAPLAAFREHGASDPVFLLGANKGHAELPVHQVASGGESARIALAVRAALAEALDTPVLVFDEIESGIGARLGDAVGRALRRIAKRRQVLVVTHLAPVAAYATHHLRVEKVVRGGVAETQVRTLSPAEREQELAAMMRGSSASRGTRGEARSLLEGASGADP